VVFLWVLAGSGGLWSAVVGSVVEATPKTIRDPYLSLFFHAND
jgi:hypothetical protein